MVATLKLATMTEAFLHFVWQYRLYDISALKTIDGDSIEVLKIGIHNTNAGPDFTNARIKIGKTIWAGDIEIHIKSKDWFAHQHQNNKKYNSVILHICYEFNGHVTNQNNIVVPVTQLHISQKVLQEFQSIQTMPNKSVCQLPLHSIDTFTKNAWFDNLVAERFTEKAARIIARYESNCNDWEETAYQSLACNFGFKTNSEAFEALANSLPLNILKKHILNNTQISALLFGQASLLTGNNEYSQKLIKEYAFLQKKYSLQPISATLWNFSRLRPSNFPAIRIAQFAKFLQKNLHICSTFLNCTTLQKTKTMFHFQIDEFWKNHYTFEKLSKTRNKHFGMSSIENIGINTIVPFLFAYGTIHQNDNAKQSALELLESLPPENNAIIKQWNSINIQTFSAYRTQALLQLSNEYCRKRKCLLCRFGQKKIYEIAQEK